MPSRRDNSSNRNSSRRGSPSSNTRIEANNTERLEAISVDVDNLKKSVDKVFRYIKEQVDRSHRTTKSSTDKAIDSIATGLEQRMYKSFKNIENKFINETLSNMEKRQNEVFSAGRSRENPNSPDNPRNSNNQPSSTSDDTRSNASAINRLDKSIGILTKSNNRLNNSINILNKTIKEYGVPNGNKQNIPNDINRRSNEPLGADIVNNIYDDLMKANRDQVRLADPITKQLEDAYRNNRQTNEHMEAIADDIRTLVESIRTNPENAGKSESELRQVIVSNTNYQKLSSQYIKEGNKLLTSTEIAVTAAKGVFEAGKKLLNIFISEFTSGMNKIVDAYESTYTKVSVLMGQNQSEYQDWQRTATNQLKGLGLSNNIGLSSIMEELSNAVDQGISGRAAQDKALADSINKTIAPFVDTTSDAYTSMQLTDSSLLETVLGLSESARDNIGQSRIISKSLNEMISQLDPISSMAKSEQFDKQFAEQALMLESLVKSRQLSSSAAEQLKQDLYDMTFDQYGTLTGGSVAQRQTLNDMYAQGKDPIQYMGDSLETLISNISDAVGSADMSGATGTLNRNILATEIAGNSRYSFLGEDIDKAIKEASQIANQGAEEAASGKSYQDLVDALANDENTTQKSQNEIEAENAATEFAIIQENFPRAVQLLEGLAGTVGQILSMLIANTATNGITNLIGGKLGRTGGGATGSGALRSIGSALKTGLTKGGISAGGAASTVAKVAGVTGLVSGAIMTGVDAYGGVQNATNWLGESGSTIGGKVASGIGGALGGTGPGITGEGTVGQKAANIGGNALKGAAIGAGIGSFIPGVGTVIGGAVGAGVGAITGAIGGENIANFLHSTGEAVVNTVTDIGKTLGDTFTNVKDGVTKVADNLIDGAKEKIDGYKEAFDEFKSDVDEKGLIKTIGDNVTTAATNAVNGVKNFFSGVGDFLFGSSDDKKASDVTKSSGTSKKKGSFATGKTRIPETGMYELHTGERVLSTTENESLIQNLADTNRSMNSIKDLIADLNNPYKAISSNEDSEDSKSVANRVIDMSLTSSPVTNLVRSITSRAANANQTTNQNSNKDVVDAINNGFSRVITAIESIGKSAEDANTINKDMLSALNKQNRGSLMSDILSSNSDLVSLKKTMSLTK